MIRTPEQNANLEKLAAYLEGLPSDYAHFDMSHFHSDGDLETSGGQINCGTVACAIGHGPTAGIKAEAEEDWPEYSQRCFTENPREWQWCFSDDWVGIDPTHQGAALRIRHMLKSGAPLDGFKQLWGTAPYLFADEVSALA